MAEPSARMCEIESRIMDDNGRQFWDENVIKNAISSHDCIEQWCYILHDKCTHPDGALKAPHYHVYLKFFKTSGARRFSDVAKWFGLEPQTVGYIKGHWADAISYATHRNKPEKHQYDYSDVRSNFDVEGVTEKRMEQRSNKKRLSEIIDAIDNGVLMPYNILNVNAGGLSMAEYVKYKTKIDIAFDARLLRIKRKADRRMDVIYIHGDSGAGKTTFAKYLAANRKIDCFVSGSGKDFLDGYLGEPCVILDDLRPDSFGFSELLKLLDNNTASSVKSRYHNVSLECTLLIITTTLSMYDFYKLVPNSQGEQYKQFIRRCGTLLRFTDTTVYSYFYNKLIGKYEFVQSFENPVAGMYSITAKTVADDRSHTLELLGLSPVRSAEIDSQSFGDLGEFVELFDETGQTN